ncbi:unnamed protein product [Rotaria sordida]|uniref:Uncharacterized protein n=1 Tax=Rotaria sordida TaxID=392033 RepID=A0A818Y8D0_9BILA|nr:unnamed protein product [Rotaria sordida]CAF3749152.1 unnamed protein product [Rotaria sordida]
MKYGQTYFIPISSLSSRLKINPFYGSNNNNNNNNLSSITHSDKECNLFHDYINSLCTQIRVLLQERLEYQKQMKIINNNSSEHQRLTNVQSAEQGNVEFNILLFIIKLFITLGSTIEILRFDNNQIRSQLSIAQR